MEAPNTPLMGPQQPRRVFVTGGTGYLGQLLIRTLLSRGHAVDAVCRPGSQTRLPAGATPIVGDVLRWDSYAAALRPDHVVVHLVGTPKPAPWKAEQFERVDLGSVVQLAAAVAVHPVAHVVYVSVAQPAPVMHAYVAARRQAEAALRETGIPLTILRPWYVLGPGHRWPYLLLPVYWLASMVPSLAPGASRLGLVTRRQMILALVSSVESAGGHSSTLEVPGIRSAVLD